MKKFLSLLACGAMLGGFAVTSHAQWGIDKIVMGTGNGNPLTLLTSGLAAPHTITIPDPGGPVNLILSNVLTGPQVINSNLTLNGTLTLPAGPGSILQADQLIAGSLTSGGTLEIYDPVSHNKISITDGNLGAGSVSALVPAVQTGSTFIMGSPLAAQTINNGITVNGGTTVNNGLTITSGLLIGSGAISTSQALTMAPVSTGNAGFTLTFQGGVSTALNGGDLDFSGGATSSSGAGNGGGVNINGGGTGAGGTGSGGPVNVNGGSPGNGSGNGGSVGINGGSSGPGGSGNGGNLLFAAGSGNNGSGNGGQVSVNGGTGGTGGPSNGGPVSINGGSGNGATGQGGQVSINGGSGTGGAGVLLLGTTSGTVTIGELAAGTTTFPGIVHFNNAPSIPLAANDIFVGSNPGGVATAVPMSQDASIVASGAVTVSQATGTFNSIGNFSVHTNKLTVDAATGNTVVAGTLGAGASTLGATTATSLNNTPIGGLTPAAGAFTTLSAAPGSVSAQSLTVSMSTAAGYTGPVSVVQNPNTSSKLFTVAYHGAGQPFAQVSVGDPTNQGSLGIHHSATNGVVTNITSSETVSRNIAFPDASGNVSLTTSAGTALFTGPATAQTYTLPAAGAALVYSGESAAGGDLGGTYPSPTVTSVADVTTGILGVANGGTNSGTALSGSSIMVSNGSSIIQGLAGTTTTVLHGNNAGVPTYGSVVNGDLGGGVYAAITGLGTQAQALNMGTHQINGVSAPTAATDAATKGYVDGQVAATTAAGTATHLAIYSGTNAIGSDANLSDASNTLTYSGTSGISASAGPVNTSSQYEISGKRVLYINGASGFENVFVGTSSGNTSAQASSDANVAIGQALNVLSTGRDNDGIGFANMGNLTSGIDNVAIGSWAGNAISAGNHNTFLGREANASSDVSSSTAVGYQAIVGGSNMMQLGSPNLVAVNTSAPITTGDGSAHTGALKITDGSTNVGVIDNLGTTHLNATVHLPAATGTLALISDIGSNGVGGDLSGTVSNANVLSVAHVTTGILPIANGGTGSATVAAANQFFANAGAGTAPGFRSIATTDLPSGGQITINAGSGIAVSGSPVALGGTVTITNNGVSSIAGTANQITPSASSGSVTLSLPTTVDLGSTSVPGAIALTDGTVDGFLGTIKLAGAIGSAQNYLLPATGGTFMLTGGLGSFSNSASNAAALTASNTFVNAATQNAIGAAISSTGVAAAGTNTALTLTASGSSVNNYGLKFNVSGTGANDIVGSAGWSVDNLGDLTAVNITSTGNTVLTPSSGGDALQVTGGSGANDITGAHWSVSALGKANFAPSVGPALSFTTTTGNDITGTAGWSVTNAGAGSFASLTSGSLVLTGTSHNGTISVPAGLGQATAYTVPDPGAASASFVMSTSASGSGFSTGQSIKTTRTDGTEALNVSSTASGGATNNALVLTANTGSTHNNAVNIVQGNVLYSSTTISGITGANPTVALTEGYSVYDLEPAGVAPTGTITITPPTGQNGEVLYIHNGTTIGTGGAGTLVSLAAGQSATLIYFPTAGWKAVGLQ